MKLFTAAILAFLTASPALAAPQCLETEKAEQQLFDGFGEEVSAAGLDTHGNWIRFWGNPESGSWTLTVTAANGFTCVVLSGGDFEHFEPAPNV